VGYLRLLPYRASTRVSAGERCRRGHSISVRRILLSASVIAASQSYAAGGVVPFALSLQADRQVISINDPSTHTVTITASAAGVAGIGAVSGFTDLRIVQDGAGDSGWFTIDILAPFDALSIGDGNAGPLIDGASGGQAAFPPAIPIDPRLDLFAFTFTDLALIERDITITITGRGGYFTTPEGQSLVPFVEFPAATITLSVVVPAPGTLVCMGLAAAGVLSGANGLKPGMVLSAEGQPHTAAGNDTMPLAMTGRVWVLCDASHGAIHRGDSLTTSMTPGHAMVATDDARASRAVIGKAMTELVEGRGMVLVLVNLQ